MENTFTECLKNYGNPNTYLNIREARKDIRLHELLNMPLTTMNGAGAQVRTSQTETQEPGKAFDAIIYLDQTTKISWAK